MLFLLLHGFVGNVVVFSLTVVLLLPSSLWTVVVVVVVVSLTLVFVVLLQPAGEGGAGDMEGDRDLLRHLSDPADGATAGLQVNDTYSASCWW